MVAGVLAVDDEGVWILNDLLIPIAGDIPHQHLVPGADALAAELRIHGGDAAHVGQRRLPANDLRDHVGDQAMVAAQLFVFVGMAVEGQHAAGDGVAGGVVAADDQQHQVAEELHGRHVAGVLTVGQHGDQVMGRGFVDPLVPQPREVLKALVQFVSTLGKGLDDAAFRAGRGHVRPIGELAPLLKGKVKQGGQHLGGQFDGHQIHPVEGLVLRQGIQNARGPLPDGALQRLEVARLHHRLHGGPLDIVLGRVHGDEHGRLQHLLLGHRQGRP